MQQFFIRTSSLSSIIPELEAPGSGFLATVLGISTVLYCGKNYFATVIINKTIQHKVDPLLRSGIPAYFFCAGVFARSAGILGDNL